VEGPSREKEHVRGGVLSQLARELGECEKESHTKVACKRAINYHDCPKKGSGEKTVGKKEGLGSTHLLRL